MNVATSLTDRGILPDSLIRLGIRRLDRQRLKTERQKSENDHRMRRQHFIDLIRSHPIVVVPEKANEQHYEVPPAFFRSVLGKHLKYSGCMWDGEVNDLNEAEARMLAVTAERAELADGMDILELGSGWGSLTLWMAENYPASRITTVSNSRDQGDYIREICRERGIANVTHITADMNTFDISERFDRVVSVEMFEHMRNWPLLLSRIENWLRPEGKLFIHIFTHRTHAYLFEDEGEDNWMGRYFFSGGMMPADDLLYDLQDDLIIEKHWQVNGVHYSKTAEAWLNNLDRRKSRVMPVLSEVYGPEAASIWFRRWRIFFMACAELWGFRNGSEWLVSHYLLRKKH